MDLLTRTTFILMLAVSCVAVDNVQAEESAEQLISDMAEAFVYGRESKNEDVLREISDAEAYEEMAKARSESDTELNENVHVDDVEITEIDGDRAVARAKYHKKNTKGSKSADVHLRRVDGQWQVSAPPKAAAD